MAPSTTATMPLKVLTVGPAVGSVRELFAKVKAIDAKHGKFELVLCVGDFFGPPEGKDASKEVDELLKGEIEVPIPCYVMQGDHPIPQSVIQKFSESGSEICRNLFLLSKSGLLTTSHGLRIACLGGLYDEQVYVSTESPLGFSDPYFSSQTVEKLLSNVTTASSSTSSNTKSSLAALTNSPVSSHLVDILISQAWPASVTRFSNSAPSAFEANHAVPAIDDIMTQAKPKYHFSTGAGSPPQFWEREPFSWADEDGRVTRFWFYAFSIAPSSSAAPAQIKPANSTANPFTSANFSGSSSAKRPVDMAEVENFIFGAIQQPAAKRPRYEKGETGKPPPGYKCRRCESTETVQNAVSRRKGISVKFATILGISFVTVPKKTRLATPVGEGRRKAMFVEPAGASQEDEIEVLLGKSDRTNDHEAHVSYSKHLLVSIGSECYVTLPKGQIIPTGDAANTAVSKVPGGGHVLIVPITHYPTLGAMPADLAVPIVAEMEQHKSALRALYARHGCGALVFEVGILSGRGGHAHVQVVPVPTRLAGRIEAAFVSEGGLMGVAFEDDPDAALEACAGGRGNYFRVDLPDGRKLVHLIKQEVPFSIQFGRQVLCKILGVPERLDWKACAQTEAEERADAQAFKQAFAPFDTMQS
ncbi:CwfJ C-terminus 2-domain-containing protein-like protein [Phellopilus nigrolimitatus]|nr:CwfJ C-terminus 2-domain-containing protein-like protein [Phellopilus nigrolimitatus]